MRKFFAVTLLVTAMIAGARMAPVIQESLQIAKSENFKTDVLKIGANEQGDQFYMQLIVEFIIKYVINNALGAGVESRVGVGEKAINAGKELTQASMNYKAAESTTDAVANAADKYSPNGMERSCRIAIETDKTTSAFLKSHLNAKSESMRDVVTAQTTTVEERSKENLDKYKDRYCSQESVAMGRCEKVGLLQNGNLDVGSLYQDGYEFGELSGQKLEAAHDFAIMASGKDTVDSLPPLLEETPEGQKFLINQMKWQAALSVGRNVFHRQINNRANTTPRELQSNAQASE